MSFAGVSVVAGARVLQPYAEPAVIYPGAASSCSWCHLLVVEGYSRVKRHTPNGMFIKGRSFSAGGYRWAVELYPNGAALEHAGFVSVFLVLDQDVDRPVKAQVRFSFISEVHRHDLASIRTTETREFSIPDQGWGHSRFVKGLDLERSQHLENDCFTIRCDLIVTDAVDAIIDVPPSNICEHLNHLLVTNIGADVMFEVGRETFTAHRCVLAARSTVFKAELFGSMKEGSSTAGAIQIQDMEPSVFKALLDFIYTDSVPEMEVEGEEEDEDQVENVTWLRHLLAAADRFDLQRLKLMCEDKLSRCIDVSSVTTILDVAAQHHCCRLKEACLEFLKVQSAQVLLGVMATSDWKHISMTDPFVLNELIAKLASKTNQ